MKDDDFKLLRGFADGRTDERTDEQTFVIVELLSQLKMQRVRKMILPTFIFIKLNLNLKVNQAPEICLVI